MAPAALAAPPGTGLVDPAPPAPGQGPPPPAAVNDAVLPRTVLAARVPVGAVVRLVVRDRRGRVRALSAPVAADPAGTAGAATRTVAVPFLARAGDGQQGPALPDGRYTLAARDDTGAGYRVDPARIVVARAAPAVDLHMDPDGSVATGVRALLPVRVRLEAGVPGQAAARIRGPWQPAGAPLVMTPAMAVMAGRRTTSLVAVARDSLGHEGRSAPVPVVSHTPVTATVVHSGKGARRVVALVFDDGYSAPAMASILDTARARGVTVTFCLNAVNAPVWSVDLRRRMRDAVRDGVLELCSHGYRHHVSDAYSYGSAHADIAANTALADIVGAPVGPYYRPPDGVLTAYNRQAAGDLGYRWVLLWSIDPSDYLTPGAAAVTQRVTGALHPGAIVVMHAIPATAAALPELLDGIAAAGYAPVGAGEVLSKTP